MMKAEAEAFASLARSYVDWLDRAVAGSPDLSELHGVLASLQAAAVRLPGRFQKNDLSAEDADIDHSAARRKAELAAKGLPFNAYSTVFDALDGNERTSIMTTIEDDLGDIYADLMDGLRAFEQGRFTDAVWQWRFLYWMHWGRHAVHAQAAVYAYLADGNWPNN